MAAIPQIIGHDREQDRLGSYLAAAGEGRLVLVGGEAGIGKTGLTRQAIGDAGLALLEGRAYWGAPLP
jgi:hypothetical protein